MMPVSDELIVFTTLYTIALVWMALKIMVTRWTDSPTPPKKIKVLRKAA